MMASDGSNRVHLEIEVVKLGLETRVMSGDGKVRLEMVRLG